MLDRGGATETDEQLAAPFSGHHGRVGRFLGRPLADKWVWDPQLRKILAYSGTTAVVSAQSLLQHVPVDERQFVADVFRTAVEHDQTVTASCRLHAADGRLVSALITAEVTADGSPGGATSSWAEAAELSAARGPWLVGQLFDVTSLRLTGARTAANQAVSAATEHRAVIEQAKGILMLAYTTDADTAFQLLRRRSQDTNTKLHHIAAALVDRVARGSADATDEFDAYLPPRTKVVDLSPGGPVMPSRRR